MSANKNSGRVPGWPRLAAIVVGRVLAAAVLAKVFLPAARSSLFGDVAHVAPWLGWTVIAVELLLGLRLISG